MRRMQKIVTPPTTLKMKKDRELKTFAEHIELSAVIIFLRFAKTRLNLDEYDKLFEIYRSYSIGGLK